MSCLAAMCIYLVNLILNHRVHRGHRDDEENGSSVFSVSSVVNNLLFDDAEEIGLAEDDELFVVDLHFGAGVFAVVDFIADVHANWGALAGVEHFAGADGDDLAAGGLFLGAFGEEDARGGFGFGFGLLHDETIIEGTDIHFFAPVIFDF